jgi:peptidyl-prolyl cis-trans isomerase B (cyclophilin B)
MQAKEAAKRQQQRRMGRIAAVLVVVLAAVGVSLGFALSGNSSPVAASASSSQSASSSAPTTTASTPLPCKYTQSGTAAKNVGVPTYDAAAAKQPYTATLQTSQGTVVIKMLTTQAPCASYSFKYLAQKGYFDNTHCHRLTTAGIYVLQCGDPTATGATGSGGEGGPGYVFPNENLTGATYPQGTVAMANTGSDDTNGSQFFLVYKSGSQLSAAYTPFGTITSGLDVIQKIAAAGVQSTGGTPGTDGAPKLPVIIQKVTITSG